VPADVTHKQKWQVRLTTERPMSNASDAAIAAGAAADAAWAFPWQRGNIL